MKIYRYLWRLLRARVKLWSLKLIYYNGTKRRTRSSLNKNSKDRLHSATTRMCLLDKIAEKRQSTFWKETSKKVIDCSEILHLIWESSEQLSLVLLCEDVTIYRVISSLLCGCKPNTGKKAFCKLFWSSHEYAISCIFFWKGFFIFVNIYTTEANHRYP